MKNPDGRLKPGGFATAALTADIRKNRPALPEAALVPTKQGYEVFVVEKEKARRRKVRIGRRKSGMVEIMEGLKIGETVVRSGIMTLSDGDRVATASVHRGE